MADLAKYASEISAIQIAMAIMSPRNDRGIKTDRANKKHGLAPCFLLL